MEIDILFAHAHRLLFENKISNQRSSSTIFLLLFAVEHRDREKSWIVSKTSSKSKTDTNRKTQNSKIVCYNELHNNEEIMLYAFVVDGVEQPLVNNLSNEYTHIITQNL